MESESISNKRQKLHHNVSPSQLFCDTHGALINLQIRSSSGQSVTLFWQNDQKLGSSVTEEDNNTQVPQQPLLSTETFRQVEQQALDHVYGYDATQSQSGCGQNSALWISKYAAQSYLQLVSDERINAQALKWLKSWQSCVFDILEGGRLQVTPYKRYDQRPDKPILTIAGPAGVGKSTLARIICKQCGYEAVEINASMDRSTKSIQDIIRSACLNQRLGQSQKAACIVIDEIDGIESGTLSSVINMFTSQSGMCRPLIFICNDSNLYKLDCARQSSEVIRLSNNSKRFQQCVVKRLESICLLEGMQLNHSQIQYLAHMCEYDMQSCVNIMQSYQGRKSIVDIEKFAPSQFNLSQGISSLWQQLLTKRYESVDNIFQSVSQIGNQDIQFSGLFHNLTNLNFLDPNFEISRKLQSFLICTDILQTRMYQQMNFALMPYLALPAVAFNLCACSTQNQQILWPSQVLNLNKRTKENQATLHSWLQKISPMQISYFDSCNATQELIPYLTWIVLAQMNNKRMRLTQFSHFLNQLGLSFELCGTSDKFVLLEKVLKPQLNVFNDVKDATCNPVIIQKILMEQERLLLRAKDELQSEDASTKSKSVQSQQQNSFVQGMSKFVKVSKQNNQTCQVANNSRSDNQTKYQHNTGLTNAVKRSIFMKELF